MRLLFTGLLLAMTSTLTSPAHAGDVFRCVDGDRTIYSDTPCGDNADQLILEDQPLGGTLKVPDMPTPWTPPDKQSDQSAASAGKNTSPCRHISSTALRRYLIREQVVPGMTTEQVRKAFGPPADTYPVPQRIWVYEATYYGRLTELTRVYFRDGCVERVERHDP